MSDVEFLDEQGQNNFAMFRSRKLLGDPTVPGLVRFLTKHGVPAKYAYYTLIFMTIIFFLASAYILYTDVFQGSFNFFPSGTSQPIGPLPINNANATR